MSLYLAFLRGINLGKRQVRMADLKACLEEIGLSELKTIVASGNVRFRADEAGDLKARIETALAKRFGFEIGVVLRSEAELAGMLANAPFDRLDPSADVTRHVIMFDKELPEGVTLTDRPRHTEVLRIDPREIYIAGYRQPNGRYTEGVDELGKQLGAQIGKGWLETMRNWNTIEKALK
jgi:uncharacterized protein (DUF1697 family)